MRPAFDDLPAADREAFDKYMVEYVEAAKKGYCSNFNVDRHHNVVKEKNVDIMVILPAPKVSTPSPTAITMDDIEGAIDRRESRFEKLLSDLNNKIDRMNGKAVNPVFPSYDMAAETASPIVSAESGSLQIQPMYGMPIGSYPGQPQPPPSILGWLPASTGLSGAPSTARLDR